MFYKFFFNKFTQFSFFVYTVSFITKLAISKKKRRRLQNQNKISHKIAENK